MGGTENLFDFTAIGLGLIYLLLSFDDLVIDFIAFKKEIKPRELTPNENWKISQRKQKKIAMVIPTWRESDIISKMLRGNIGEISYENYHIFVGCYPNDLATFRAVSAVARETNKVTALVNSLPGPTSKGQLLNFIVRELLENQYPLFDLYLFHDAEDIIHPLSLKLINSEAEKADFVQIPVFSLPIKKRWSIGATYMDEFAEVHTRDLLVRKSVQAGLPSAGVGFALTRRGLITLLDKPSGNLFDPSCLTEDYLLGLRAHQLGLKQSFPCVFVKKEGGRTDWIATYEFFPKQFWRSVRQKARWTQGIAIQAAKNLGWFGTLLNSLFLFRDRKALLANCLGLLGILVFPLFCFKVVKTSYPVFTINGALLLYRLYRRTVALKRVYSHRSIVEVLLRYPLSIFVNGFAGLLAIRNYSISILTKTPTLWVKTDHELPEGFGQIKAQSMRGVL